MGRPFFIPLMLLFTLSTSSGQAAPRALVLSASSHPAAQSFEQYLQTRTLVEYVRTQAPAPFVTLMSGSGNRPAVPARIADVHQLIRENEKDYSSMVPGELLGNVPVLKENVLRYFDSYPVRSMERNEVLFLFVSGHGMPNRDVGGQPDLSYSNNCLDLWGFEASASRFTLRPFNERCFSKNELGRILNQKVPAGRIVFSMAQCYSGGFHQMSVSVEAGYPKADPRVCGFTSTTEDSWASSCAPEANGLTREIHEQGYERFFTEQLTGRDIVTNQTLRSPRPTLQLAHEAATLQDLTVNVPLSTSDYYLREWSKAIRSASFRPRTNVVSAVKALQTFEQAAAMRTVVREANFQRHLKFTQLMSEQVAKAYPALANLIRNGSLAQIEQQQAFLQRDLDRIEFEMTSLHGRNFDLRARAIFPAWVTAVALGTAGLTADETKAERGLLLDIEKKSGFDNLKSFARMHLSLLAIDSPDKAKILRRYLTEREDRIAAWGTRTVTVERALAEFTANQKRFKELELLKLDLEKQASLLRRLSVYRSALGAWATLVAMKDTEALRELGGLLACEATPF